MAPATNSLVNAEAPESSKVGVFTTPQSLVTFPGAVGAVTTVWKVLGSINQSWGEENKLVPILVAFVVGMLIYSTSATKGTTKPQKLSEFGIALINSFTIAAAALGIG